MGKDQDAEQIRLADIRAKKQMSIRALASASGVDRSKISRWENGQGFLTVDDAIKVAKSLGCTVEELFTRRDPNSAKPTK